MVVVGLWLKEARTAGALSKTRAPPKPTETMMNLKTAVVLAILGWTSAAQAGFCGEAECGPHGSCDLVSLLGKCNCDDGFASVTTYIGDGRLGAFCVPLAAPPSDLACSPFSCGPHGVCQSAVAAADAGLSDAGPSAACVCDPGYRPDGEGHCEDDPDDDDETRCAPVRCGDDATCMVVPDGETCRCAPGGSVVLGRADNDGFGPVCSYPPDPDTACGPLSCGPHGDCVLSQAIFCDCEAGYRSERIPHDDGRSYSYCIDEAGPVPDLIHIGDGGALEMIGDAGPNAPVEEDAGTPPLPETPKQKKGGCTLTASDLESNESTPSGLALFVGFGLATLLGRRRRSSTKRA
jgi:hypothetical protein